MQEIKDRISVLTDEICRLYYDRVNVEKAIEEMQAQNVSTTFIEGLYEQLSMEAKTFFKRCRKNAKKGLYYRIDKDKRGHYFAVWTSRYLIAYKYESPGSDSHKFTVFDSFNDKSL
jgi:hypothetical protein